MDIYLVGFNISIYLVGFLHLLQPPLVTVMNSCIVELHAAMWDSLNLIHHSTQYRPASGICYFLQLYSDATHLGSDHVAACFVFYDHVSSAYKIPKDAQF